MKQHEIKRSVALKGRHREGGTSFLQTLVDGALAGKIRIENGELRIENGSVRSRDIPLLLNN